MSTLPPGQTTSQQNLNQIVLEYLHKKGYMRTASELLDETNPPAEGDATPLLVISSTISQDGTKGIRIEQDGNLVAVFKKDASLSLLSDQELARRALPSYASPPSDIRGQTGNPEAPSGTPPIPIVTPSPKQVVSQPLPSTKPNAEKKVVRGWRAETEEEEQDDIPAGKSVVDKASDKDDAATTAADRELPDRSLASVLARAGTSRLGVDLYGDSQTARFCGTLLDTIQKLESESKYWQRLYAKEMGELSNSDNEESEEPKNPDEEDRATEEDLIVPPPRTPTAGKLWVKGHLTGSQPIPNLGRYLEVNEHVDAVLLHVYACLNVYPQSCSKNIDGKGFTPREIKVIATDAYICINSKDLEAALTREALYQIPRVNQAVLPLGLGLGVSTPWFRTPFPFIFHHMKAWDSAVCNGRDSDGSIKGFLDFVALHLGGSVNAETERLFSNGFATTKHVELLFRPNGIVISGKNKELIACAMKGPPIIQPGGFSLRCWMWKFDGNVFERETCSFFVPMASNSEISIKSLDAYPVEYAEKSLIDHLTNRGRKFWNYKKQAFVSYRGWDANQDLNHVNARFMIDWATYRRAHPHPESFKRSMAYTRNDHEMMDHLPENMTCNEEPTAKSLMLLPAILNGFNFQEKKWMSLRVDGIDNVDWNKKAFEHLILPKSTKKLVSALVKTHEGAAAQEDVIAGKGNGVILLLHGGPGTGKTLTAESVAEMAERPLYRVTCGDIGTDADSVEKYLTTVLYLGRIWNCVLLFDEADMFLEERTLFDLPRNSLVSVFLRILEYYDGILILTSNRVGTFDEAFKSRIQVAIHYRDLTKITRKKIWETFIGMMEESEYNADIDQLYERIDELADKNMNGRQIRNAITTARRLALFENKRLNWEHLSSVIQISSDFDQYLKEVHKTSDADRARDGGIR